MLPRGPFLPLTVLLLAGCTGGGPGIFEPGIHDQDGTPLLTATQALRLARVDAEAWSADAKLIAMSTAEPASDEVSFPGARPPYRIFVDQDLGDGRAAQWFLNFHSLALGQALSLVVAGDGEIGRRPPGSAPTARTAGAWTVDSPLAARIALRDGNVSLAANQTDGLLVYNLAPQGAHAAVWTMAARSDAASIPTTFVYVNATSGALLSSEDLRR